MTHFIPYVAKYGLINEYVESNKTHVVLSHMPLLFKPDKFAFNVSYKWRKVLIWKIKKKRRRISKKIIFTASISGYQRTSSSNNIHRTRTQGNVHKRRYNTGTVQRNQTHTCDQDTSLPNEPLRGRHLWIFNTDLLLPYGCPGHGLWISIHR